MIAIASFAAMFLGLSAAQIHAQKVDLPGGFRLGSSLEEAQLHATSLNWKLDQLSPQFPRAWIVKEQDIALHFCNESLVSITHDTSGSLDEFAQIILELEMLRGKPEVKIGTFMSGGVRFADVSARFPDVDGVGVGVRLDSIAGKHSIKTNYFTGTGSCG